MPNNIHPPLLAFISSISWRPAQIIRRVLLVIFLKILTTGAIASELKLVSPAGYLPGVPFLVRVEALDSSGKPNKDLWDATAVLETDNAGIQLSTNRVQLRNGIGTVLVSIQGSVDFQLSASLNTRKAARSIRSLAAPPVQSLSGALPGSSTTWSGVIRITDDVTVPMNHVLTIQPGTMVLIDGVSSGTTAPDILVNGSIQSLGTDEQPITITCSNSDLNWGQIRHNNAQPSHYRSTLISRAGRAPGEGHTGTGPAIRPSNSTITIESCVISDLTARGSSIGKVMMANSSSLTVRDSVFARARMGPEIAGTELFCTNSFFMDMTGPDDADGIYLHSSGGRLLVLSGCVLARGDDDAVDTLDSNVTLENCIIRDWPNPNEDAKGVSIFHGEVILKRCLIVNCFVGVSAKSSGTLATMRLDHCTISGIEKGVSAALKSNATTGNIQCYLTNSIVKSSDALHSDFGAEKFVSVSYCNLSEPWPGIGNQALDPRFADEAGGDYRLLPDSPAIDSGDPSFPMDPDGSRTDIGFFTANLLQRNLIVSLTTPLPGTVFTAPTNVALVANATAATGGVDRVEFYLNELMLGQDVAAPYSLIWTNARIGRHAVRAVAYQTGGSAATSAPVAISVLSGEPPVTNLFVSSRSSWKYLDDGTDQSTNWVDLRFDDKLWKSGQGEFGYGDGDEATVLSFGPNSNNKYVTYYFRRAFVVEDPARVRSLRLSVLRDDGAVSYLNGQEVSRLSMPAGPVTYQTYATSASEYSWESVELSPSMLVAGTNVVAVEVHQGNASSSDLSFDLELIGVLSPATNARPSVYIVSPASNTIFPASASIVLTAEAFDADGVTNVSFYSNEARLGEDTSSPYSLIWTNVPAGRYNLTAVATDASGMTATSEPVILIVSTNAAPPQIISRLPAEFSVTNLVSIIVEFSKDVKGVDAADLHINGVPALSVSGQGTKYTFFFNQPASGSVLVSWNPLHGITDTFEPAAAFDQTAQNASWRYQLNDVQAPVMHRIHPIPGAVVPPLNKVEISFNEAVTGIVAQSLLINSIPATNMSGSGAGPYIFTFPLLENQNLSVNWNSTNQIRDIAGNQFAGGHWSYRTQKDGNTVIINELMYHPPSDNPLEEYIELFNNGSSAVNMKGWRISDGVEFVFPEISIPAQGYLVVAADLMAFKSRHPNVQNVTGGWRGRLSNSGEKIVLHDARGNQADSLAYADEGDWADRQRGALDRGYRGWIWASQHDGGGKSMELVNPDMPRDSGQNWRSSNVDYGTPGEVNSVQSRNIAPLIKNVAHYPIIPKSMDSVAIVAEIKDELGAPAAVRLNYRPSALVPGEFASISMQDDGRGGDLAPGDGLFTAIIPPHTNHTVIEFFISAGDLFGNTRTWPAPTVPAADGSGPAGQVANALYQVDDSAAPTGSPLYRIIMTEGERLELSEIHANRNGSANSDAQMNATFLSMEGERTELRYLAGVRNRGHGTRTARPNNFRVNFRNDETWRGVRALNLNAQFSWLQVLGAALNLKSRVAGAYSRPVLLRVNNVDPSQAGTPDRTFGFYAANEAINEDWASLHFPDDDQGNIYRAIRDLAPSDFDYRTSQAYPGLYGADEKNSYTNTWFKITNTSQDDWSDLIGMLRIFGINGTTEFSAANIRQVINTDQWLRHLAVMNLLGNSETGLNSGYNDDYFMYRGVKDPRFVLMYYDLDQILGFGGSFPPNSSLFSATASDGGRGAGQAFDRFLHHQEFEPVYYAHLRDLLSTTFSEPEFNAIVDEVLAGLVPELIRQQVKSWMAARRAFVLSQLPPAGPGRAPVAQLKGVPRSPTPIQTATLSVGGEGVTHYRFSVNGGPLSQDVPVITPIVLSGLKDGTNTVRVVGKNLSGVYQAETNATAALWVVNSQWPGIRINEILASPGQNRRDQIELHNEGGQTINLAGMQLSDNPAIPGRFRFGNVNLLPGAYLVLDSDQLGFSFDKSGDALYLFDDANRSGALLDSVQFGLQLQDFSIGRIHGGEWALTLPTLGAANLEQSLGSSRQLRINEWLAASTGSQANDFVELFNPETLPAALGGLYLTDQPIGAPNKSRIAPLSFIDANGYAVFKADDGSHPGEISFGLSAEQGEIGLFESDFSIVDSVLYGLQSPGKSSGRCPDGTPGQKQLVTPTPGSSNQCPVMPPAPELTTLVAFTNIWNYNDSGTDLGTNWIQSSYNDSAWKSGRGLLGLEDSVLPETLLTTIPDVRNKITFYFRTWFDFDERVKPAAVQLTHVIDDGAAFYLNGKEVGSRFNLPSQASFDTPASATVGEAGYQVITIPSDSIKPGRNLLAVEVHQVNRNSGDLVFGLRLDAVVPSGTAGQAGVVINEVFADNENHLEADGTSLDWIELYNPSAQQVDLSGMSLTDDPANGTKYVFSAGTILGSRQFLKIYCHADTPPSASNTGLELKKGGGVLMLMDKPGANAAVISSVTYGLQAADWSIGCVPDGSTNWVLNSPTPAAANTAASTGDPKWLKINEWMADPLFGNDWFEIYNGDSKPINVSGFWLSDDLADLRKTQIPPLSFIGTGDGAFWLFMADEQSGSGAEHVSFKLAASGESVAISNSDGVPIDGISFGHQQAGVSQGRLPDGSADFRTFESSSSPGAGNYIALRDVVISEIMPAAFPPLQAAIELFNPGNRDIDISGWYLSGTAADLKKYRVPDGTVVPARAYYVLYGAHFNKAGSNQLFWQPLLEHGRLYLSQAINNSLTGVRGLAQFDKVLEGESVGSLRTSYGVEFVPMLQRTFGVDVPSSTNQFAQGKGAANSHPRIGPLVIGEIMYHPAKDIDLLEYIELINISEVPVVLKDIAAATGWRLRGGIEFDFPAGTVLPGESLVVVGFDPLVDSAALAAFQAEYNPKAKLVGPYRGQLSNSEDRIELQSSHKVFSTAGQTSMSSYVAMDRVHFSDKAPWPESPDGSGHSLQRIAGWFYGNDPSHWFAAPPNPGSRLQADADGDLMPDDWELASRLNSTNAQDGSEDADGDGSSNLNEFLAGTNPNDPASVFRVDTLSVGSRELLFQFPTARDRSYVIESCSELIGNQWQEAAVLDGKFVSQEVRMPADTASRFFRIQIKKP